jgi:hypothetical protein
MIGSELVEFVDSDTANVESCFTMWLVLQEESVETVSGGRSRCASSGGPLIRLAVDHLADEREPKRLRSR